MVNIMDFGTMLRLYKGSSIEVRNRIANEVGISARVLESWLVTLNTVRNICAQSRSPLEQRYWYTTDHSNREKIPGVA